MSDEPDDLMDQRGRMNRLLASLVVGVALGAIAYVLCMQLAKPDEVTSASVTLDSGKSGAYRFVYYLTGGALAGGFVVTLVILNARAAKRWRERRVPPAKALS